MTDEHWTLRLRQLADDMKKCALDLYEDARPMNVGPTPQPNLAAGWLLLVRRLGRDLVQLEDELRRLAPREGL